MNNIIRFWNQNRKGIIVGIIAIVLLIVIIQVMNQAAKEQKQKKNINTTIDETVEDLPNKSIITGETVKEETTKTNVSLIENFLEQCNKQDIEAAYELLTDECKEVLFNTKEDFVNNYYNIIFTETRTINIENYKNSSKTNTYKITFYEDALETGNASGTNTYQDYITVDKESGKLNINSLITSQEINTKTEQDGIIVTVLRQDIYKDYERYQIKVENNTSNTIVLDTRTNQKTVYATGNDNVKYNAFTNEISSNLYEISQYGVKVYNLKFNKKYDSSITTKKITLSDIIANYEKYTEENTDERLKIEVKL